MGPGRLGQSLGRLLAEAGVPVVAVAARRLARARKAARFIGSGKAGTLVETDLARAGVVLITTSDAAVARVARRLASVRRDWSDSVVLHTAGALTASALEPLARRGAAVGSMHPFQTMPSPEQGVRDLPGSTWSIEGDAKAQRAARRLIRALGGRAFRLPSAGKLLYHAAAFLACGGVVTLMDQSARLLEKSGAPRTLIGPMLGRFVEQTARNFGALGAREALTGPAARGDWTTIRRHLVALGRSSPEAVGVYTALVREMARLAGRRPPRWLALR